MASNDDSINNAVKFEKMQLILRVVGTFGHDGALLQEIEGIQTNNFIFRVHFCNIFSKLFSVKFIRIFQREIVTDWVHELIEMGSILKGDDGRLRVWDESYMRHTDDYLEYAF